MIAERGEIFGILGPNGAGKTTTMRMITTDLHPDKGKVVTQTFFFFSFFLFLFYRLQNIQKDILFSKFDLTLD